MEQIIRVPQELVKIIPIFDGDSRLLPLFVTKCEYILRSFQGEGPQNEYLFHVITSRLSGDAARLVGERDTISNWNELKQLLGHHFGDPRTEECIAMELESSKIQRGESYLDFCHRLQHIRSVLFSKINETIIDQNLRQAKQHIYDHSTLNVFLYNLPAYLVRLVRIRNVTTLEDALKVVLEEQNFQTVYDFKNNQRNNSSHFNRNQSNSWHRFNSQNPNNSRPMDNQNIRVPNSMPGTSFSSPNNSFQIRNQRPYNNANYNNYNNNHQWQNGSRSTPPAFNQQLSRHLQPQRNVSPVASGSNTDVTMRTASSRRVNYIDNYEPQSMVNDSMSNSNMQNSFENSNEENFSMMASTIEKE